MKVFVQNFVWVYFQFFDQNVYRENRIIESISKRNFEEFLSKNFSKLLSTNFRIFSKFFEKTFWEKIWLEFVF